MAFFLVLFSLVGFAFSTAGESEQKSLCKQKWVWHFSFKPPPFPSPRAGGIGWREYPTLRGMIEMVMTNTYTFPVSMSLATNEDGSTESRDSAIMRELQVGGGWVVCRWCVGGYIGSIQIVCAIVYGKYIDSV